MAEQTTLYKTCLIQVRFLTFPLGRCGGIGIHRDLKSLRCEAYGFKSRHRHTEKGSNMNLQERTIKMQNRKPRKDTGVTRIPMRGRSIAAAKGIMKDLRISVCTDCERGIFIDHEYVWTSRGLVHTKCEEIKNETKSVT